MRVSRPAVTGAALSAWDREGSTKSPGLRPGGDLGARCRAILRAVYAVAAKRPSPPHGAPVPGCRDVHAGGAPALSRADGGARHLGAPRRGVALLLSGPGPTALSYALFTTASPESRPRGGHRHAPAADGGHPRVTLVRRVPGLAGHRGRCSSPRLPSRWRLPRCRLVFDACGHGPEDAGRLLHVLSRRSPGLRAGTVAQPARVRRR